MLSIVPSGMCKPGFDYTRHLTRAAACACAACSPECSHAGHPAQQQGGRDGCHAVLAVPGSLYYTPSSSVILPVAAQHACNEYGLKSSTMQQRAAPSAPAWQPTIIVSPCQGMSLMSQQQHELRGSTTSRHWRIDCIEIRRAIWVCITPRFLDLALSRDQ